MEKLIYTPEEARELLGVGEKAFRRLPIAYIKIGMRKRYRLDDLKDFINSMPIRLTPNQTRD